MDLKERGFFLSFWGLKTLRDNSGFISYHHLVYDTFWYKLSDEWVRFNLYKN